MMIRGSAMLKEMFERIRRRSWKIYDHYYGADYVHHNDRYRAEVVKYIGPDTILLDAGAGELGFTKEFAPKVRLAIGTDMGEMKAVHGVSAVRSNLEHLPFKDGTIDVIISMSVVEHLTNPVASFRELARVLKPKGVMIAQTPSKYDYVSILAHMTPFWFHRLLLSHLLDRRAEDVFPTCFRSNTRKAMTRCLEAARFQPMSVLFFNQYPAYLMFWPLLFRLGIYYERLTTKHDSLAQLRGWILAVARKQS
jgi:SAM-dependent methyltransferase